MTPSASSSDPSTGAVRPLASPLVSRVVVGFSLLGFFLLLVWADATGFAGARPAWWLLPVALVLAVGAAEELRSLLAARGFAARGAVVIGAMFVPLAAALGSPAFHGADLAGPPAVACGWAALALLGGVAAAFLVEIVLYRPQGQALERLLAAVLMMVVVGLPLSAIVALRLLGMPRGDGTWGPPGLLPLLSLVAVVKSGDVAAYLVGSTCGRRKMAPILSPGKTWEGVAGSFAGALLAAWIALVVIGQSGVAGNPGPWGGFGVYGVAVGAAGIMGDLAESLLKREAGFKDSGSTLGGMGGILDLTDSLLFAAPVAWLLWTAAG
ncbi:MAG: hypothetical protein DWH79_01540 [Planctomycetota bacterium]|nr:MAG: hypothetical protein DWH79_01540 [Planctomycetota bacterium]